MPKLGPLSIDEHQIDFQAIRTQHDSFYETSKKFAEHHGNDFAKMVAERIDPNVETTILVAMGGAEHLGTLFEIYAAQQLLHAKLKFRYVDLSIKIVKPWTAVSREWKRARVGIGPIPEGYEANGSNNSNPAELKEYLADKDVFSSPRVIVLDTGFRGSIVEAVGYVAKDVNPSIHVEGALISMSDGIDSVTPIVSLTKPRMLVNDDLAKWATRLDHNNAQGAQIGMHPGWLDAFRRSSAVTDKKTLDSYKSTIAGLVDGLANVENAKKERHAALMKRYGIHD